MKFAKFLRTHFLTKNTSGGCFCSLVLIHLFVTLPLHSFIYKECHDSFIKKTNKRRTLSTFRNCIKYDFFGDFTLACKITQRSIDVNHSFAEILLEVPYVLCKFIFHPLHRGLLSENRRSH